MICLCRPISSKTKPHERINPYRMTQKIAKDLTRGSVSKLLLSFSWPLMLASLLQLVYQMVDMIIVGQVIGSTGVVAISNGGELLNFGTMLCMGFANAGQVVISQVYGSKNLDGLKHVIGTLFAFLALLGIVTGAVMLLSIDWVLNVLNVPAEAYEQARNYSMICFAGMLMIFGYNTVSAILRGLGDAMRPFLFIGIATVVNLVLDIVFVMVLGMGTAGAAWATVIGQSVSFLWSLFYLYKRREAFGFDFKLKSFRINQKALRNILRIGTPMAILFSAVGISRMFISAFINSYGVILAAVNGIGNRISMCAMVVTQALGTASTSIVGQNCGAGKTGRISKTIHLSLLYGGIFAVFLSVLIVLFPDAIFSVFDSSPDVLQAAHMYIGIAALQFIGAAIRSPMLALINGLGNAKLSMLISMLDAIIARIGIAYLLGHVIGMGVMGFWVGDVSASFVPFFVGAVYFWSGQWKKRKYLTI